MNKSRLEAFSDGVFAIAITLLILDVRLPEVSYDHLWQALKEIIPNILAYVMSFLVIGMYWVGHHTSFRIVAKTDGVLLWLNILLLLCISFIPFPTSMLGKYPQGEIPLIIYGCNLLATNFIAFLMIKYLHHHPELGSEHFHDKYFNDQMPVFGTVNGSYLLAIFLAHYSPLASYLIYGLILILLIVIYVRRTR